MGGCDPAVRGVRWLMLFLYHLFLCPFLLRLSSFVFDVSSNLIRFDLSRQCAQQGKHYVDLTVSHIVLPFLSFCEGVFCRFRVWGGFGLTLGYDFDFNGC
jgi:hypothetical protein